MAVKKSIAIIGEGETEWWYFETLRVACRYKFKVAPDFPQHSDIPHMAKLAEDYVKRETDHVVCLVDMDRLLRVPAEMATYQKLKKKSSRNVIWIETNPCTEFWFLLHFLPQISTKRYETCEDVLPDLQRYMPGYEKTARYFRNNNLYNYLTEHGDLQRAIENAKELSRLSEETPEDRIAYSQMHKVFELIASMNVDESEKGNISESKTGNQNRSKEYRRQIIDFIAENKISDSKTISKVIGLKVSRTRDYLKQLVDEGILEIEGEYKNRKYKIKK
ncbi:RloB family protein [Prevotella sp. P6B1]|uniref:RloB family protein n=1 Tax=Prevotella sp. P6B1 TaxID=1410613 RepID=UPI0009DE48A1